MNRTDAFAHFGANLRNTVWSCCALNQEGELVLSLWQPLFGAPSGGKIKYRGDMQVWTGPGRDEFTNAMDEAVENDRPLRCVLLHTTEPEKLKEKGSKLGVKKSYSVRPDWVGRILSWDGVIFELEFESVKH